LEDITDKNFNIKIEEMNLVEQKMALMFYYDLFQTAGYYDSLNNMFRELSKDELFCKEMMELIPLLKNRCEAYEMKDNSSIINFPLKLHGVYTKDQIFVAIGTSTLQKKSSCREGAERNKQLNLEAMFVDIIKDREEGSNTNYNDFAITDRLFNWETQNRVTPNSQAGQNYINQTQTMLLFVRQQDRFPEDKSRTMGTARERSRYCQVFNRCPIDIAERSLKPRRTTDRQRNGLVVAIECASISVATVANHRCDGDIICHQLCIGINSNRSVVDAIGKYPPIIR